MAYPKVVVFDLDGTIWSDWLDQSQIGRLGLAGSALEDNLEIHGNEIRDCRDPSLKVTVSSDVYWIIRDLLSNGVRVAVSSRNANPDMCNRALGLIKMQVPLGDDYKPAIDFVSWSEISNGKAPYSKTELRLTFQQFRNRRIILFDNQAPNNEVEMWQGVTFHQVDGSRCITTSDYLSGLDTWRRNQIIRCPMPTHSPNPHPNAKTIGWVGTDKHTSDLYMNGQRRTKSGRPSRWGFALYVADDPSIAAEFAKWRRDSDTDNQYICEIYVRDFEIFRAMDKVWVPEDGPAPQTNSDRGDNHIAEVQCNRDNIVANTFAVHKPYILFARHKWMDFLSMTWRQNHHGRFSEMVVYPQIQDALCYGKRWKLSDVQQHINAGRDLNGNPFRGFDFRHKLKKWNIRWSQETVADFKKHKEDFR
ncbi:acid phosphatase-domain-containing protein [Nemania abortiva]|nr:acid phosphatase-domain-containing protein [Nemania abortiva]